MWLKLLRLLLSSSSFSVFIAHAFVSSSSSAVSGGWRGSVTLRSHSHSSWNFPFNRIHPSLFPHWRQSPSHSFNSPADTCPFTYTDPGRQGHRSMLAVKSKPAVLHHGTCTNELLFQMNFRRGQIIFPCANLWNSIHFLRKCRWTIRKYRLSLLITESSFFRMHKKRIQRLIICCHLTQ